MSPPGPPVPYRTTLQLAPGWVQAARTVAGTEVSSS